MIHLSSARQSLRSYVNSKQELTALFLRAFRPTSGSSTLDAETAMVSFIFGLSADDHVVLSVLSKVSMYSK